MSERDFPSLVAPGETPKLTSIFQVSAEFLGQLRLWFEMNPPRVPLENVLGFPVQSRFLDRSATSVDVVSTTTETSIYSKQINAGDMGVDRLLRLTVTGDYLHNNVAGDTISLRVKFGGTTFWGNTSNVGNLTAAARHPWGLVIHIANLGSPSSQYIYGWFISEVVDAAAPAIAGIGNALVRDNSLLSLPLGISTLGTIDTTVAQTLDVTAKWSASSANNSWRKRYATLELV